MIEAPKDITQVTNFDQSKAIDVRLSDSEPARKVLLDLLINKTYTNKPWAIVREYATNAMDANIAAGRGDTPIEILMPAMYGHYYGAAPLSKEHTEFYVRDFGNGLDPNEMYEVFVALGESTKRLSNDQTGMMGIGAKAGFCYGDFRLVSIKDGKKYKYLATKNASGLPTFVPIGDVEDTKEHSGVSVHFSIKKEDIAYVRSHIRFLCTFSKVKPKIIDPANEVDKSVDLKPILSDDNWAILKTGGNIGDFNVVMGNICYACRHPDLVSELRAFLFNGYGLVAYVKMGEVSFTSSREELEYTDHTMRSLRRYISTLKGKLQAKIDAEVASAKNIFEAVRKYESFKSFFTLNGFTWNTIKYDSGFKFKNIYCRILETRGRRRIYDREVTELKNDKGVVVDINSNEEARLLIGAHPTFKVVSNINLKESRRNRWRFNTLKNNNVTCVMEITSMPAEYGVVDAELDFSTVAFTKPPASARRTYVDVYEYNDDDNDWEALDNDWEALENDEIPDGEKIFITLETSNGVNVYHSQIRENMREFATKLGKPIYGIRKTRLKNVITDDNKNDWIHIGTELKKHYTWEKLGELESLANNESWRQLAHNLKATKLIKLYDEIEAFKKRGTDTCPIGLRIEFSELDGTYISNNLPTPSKVIPAPSVKKEITALQQAHPWLLMLSYYQLTYSETAQHVLAMNARHNIKIPEIF